ncbi:putative lipoprotein [Archangium gephyra]|uniref:Lipoprotein n=1 Tax=Archangium gephyra TaxID=48 RepID=A0AAC8QAF4_9BACT|nr:putative lipoprotein [Archangium gephyra]
MDEDFVLGVACDGPDSDQCQEGKVVCAADGSTTCGDTSPDSVEVCNLSDDDCDGEVDEGFHTGESCDGKDSDLCAEGEFICNASGAAVCSDVTSNTLERCNGVDDDCDGQVDEDFVLGVACDGPDSDQCQEGKVVCAADGSTTCGDTSPDSVEVCNLSDDDCDGEVDEGFVLGVACDGPDSDQCQEGKVVCAADGSTTCGDTSSDSVEVCNLSDDDCDGQVDEDFVLGVACDGPDSDQCQEGKVVCAADGSTTCGDTSPDSVEVCNLSDDDCDGEVDEGFHTGESCDGKDSDLCAEGEFICNASGTAVCSDVTSNTLERCNGADDDCDGQVDEDFDLTKDPAHCGRCDKACTATEWCSSGACLPSSELSCGNGLDDDGDLSLDCADLDCDGQACGTGCLCQEGVRTESVCGDGLDNDGDMRADCDDPDCDGPACEGPPSLTITPSNVLLVVQGHSGATQAFTVTATWPDGRTADVTALADLSIDDTRLGSFLGATFTSGTSVGGISTVRAQIDSLAASTSLTVKLAHRIPDSTTGPLPTVPETRFDGAVDASRTPRILYPSNGTLLPPNLEKGELHFDPGPAANNLFELSFGNDITDLRVYLRCTLPSGFVLPSGVSRGCIYTPPQAIWDFVAETNRGGQPVRVVLRATEESGSATVGVSEPITLLISQSALEGTLSYFSTSGGTGLVRYDFSSPPPRSLVPLFRASNINTSVACVGCHAVSRDGKKMVVEVNGQNDGRIALVDMSSFTSTTRVPLAQGGTKLSMFQSWSPDSTRFVGVYADNSATSYNLRLFDGSTAALLGDIPNTGTRTNPANHPDWSADGQTIAYMSMGIAGTNQRSYKGAIKAVMAQPGGSWSEPVTVVPSQGGKNRYAPAIAPDSSFLVYSESTCPGTAEVHTDCNSDSDPSARLWAALLHASAAPVELARANAPSPLIGTPVNPTNSYPRWNPQVGRGAAGTSRVMWVVFASTRMYGLRAPAASAGSAENPRSALLWMAAVDPDKLAQGLDPSFPAFALPFQELNASNHVPHWMVSPSSP